MSEDRTEFVNALRAAAFEAGDCGHPGCTEHTERRRIIHTFVGPLGADWDLEDAEQFIADADQVKWTDSLFGHNLWAMSPDRRIVNFDVKGPA